MIQKKTDACASVFFMAWFRKTQSIFLLIKMWDRTPTTSSMAAMPMLKLDVVPLKAGTANTTTAINTRMMPRFFNNAFIVPVFDMFGFTEVKCSQ
jgi:hypothetical protein